MATLNLKPEPKPKPLTHLYHVTHIDNAIQIIKDKKIISRLVYDNDNKLKTERIEVVWFSYKTYPEGYNFGSIRFCIDVKRHFIGKNFYYIGFSKTKLDVIQHKILVSSEKYPDLDVYDFDKEYFTKVDDTYSVIDSNTQNIHFLFEGNIDISKFKSIDFVEHKKDACKLEIDSNFKFKCKEKNKTLKRLNSWFIAKVIINEIKVVGLNFSKNALFEAFNYLQNELKTDVTKKKIVYKKILNSSMNEAKLIFNLVLQYYTESKINEMCSLIALFQSFEDFTKLFDVSVLTEQNLIENITGIKFEGYYLSTSYDSLEGSCGVILLVNKDYNKKNFQRIEYVEVTNNVNKTLSEVGDEILHRCNSVYFYHEKNEQECNKIKADIQKKIKKL